MEAADSDASMPALQTAGERGQEMPPSPYPSPPVGEREFGERACGGDCSSWLAGGYCLS